MKRQKALTGLDLLLVVNTVFLSTGIIHLSTVDSFIDSLMSGGRDQVALSTGVR